MAALRVMCAALPITLTGAIPQVYRPASCSIWSHVSVF